MAPKIVEYSREDQDLWEKMLEKSFTPGEWYYDDASPHREDLKVMEDGKRNGSKESPNRENGIPECLKRRMEGASYRDL